MILDYETLLASAQTVTDSAATTNIIDLGAAPGDLGNLKAFVNVDEAATATGAATVTFAIQTATDAAFTSPVTLMSSAAIGKASLTADSTHFKVRMPIEGVLRYVRGYYTVATGPLTAGKFTFGLVADVQTNS